MIHIGGSRTLTLRTQNSLLMLRMPSRFRFLRSVRCAPNYMTGAFYYILDFFFVQHNICPNIFTPVICNRCSIDDVASYRKISHHMVQLPLLQD